MQNGNEADFDGYKMCNILESKTWISELTKFQLENIVGYDLFKKNSLTYLRRKNFSNKTQITTYKCKYTYMYTLGHRP